jgi:hypothetical protein
MANDGKAEVERFEIDNPGQNVVVIMLRRTGHDGPHGSVLRAKIQRAVGIGHGQNNSPGSAEDLHLKEMGNIELVTTDQRLEGLLNREGVCSLWTRCGLSGAFGPALTNRWSSP